MAQNQLIERFKGFYRNMLATERAELDAIYAPDVRFCDPVHQVDGRPALHHYIDELSRNVTECRFEYLDEAVFDDKAYIKWTMHFAHPRLGKKTIRVRGVSHIEYNGDGVHYHEDFYDMGAMLYENVPLMGAGVRWLKHRLVG